MKLPELAVRRSVSTTMFFLAVVLMGTVALRGMKVDLLPEIEPPVITILTTWPGASAVDVEQRVSKEMEDQMALVEGVDEIYSKSVENLSVVSVKFNWDADLDVKVGDVRDAVTFAKRHLPDDVEEPLILRLSSGTIPVMEMALTAERSYPGLYHFADSVIVENFKQVEGVGQVLIYGGKQREIRVDLDLDRLEALRLGASAVIAALERENLNLPAGTLKEGSTGYNIRVPGRFGSVGEIGNIIVGVHEGRPVRLGDVGRVVDGYREMDVRGWLGDRPSVVLVVLKNSGANTVEVTRGLNRKLEELRGRFPSDVEATMVFNTADYIRMSLANLTSSLLWGILLVFLVTWGFLRRLPSSLVVCTAVPFSLVITFIVMRQADFTLNIMTLSALAVASGMVVDNAIVATEQIIYHLESGERGSVAAVLGAGEVGPALVASTMTTVVVLLPMAFISGLVGVFFASLSLVMIMAVAASLAVALTFVPVLAARFFRKTESRSFLFARIGRGFTGLEQAYRGFLDWALDNRKTILAVGVLLLILTFIGFRYIGTELTADPDTGEVSITMRFPEGTRNEVTDAFVRQVVAYCRENVPEARWVFGWDGQTEEGYGIATGQDEGPNVGTVGLKLVDKADRDRSASEVAQQIRSWLREKPGIDQMTVYVSSPVKAMFLGAKPISIEVYGDDLAEVLAVARRVQQAVAGVPGAVEVTLSQKPDRPEIVIEVDRDRAALLGVGTSEVAATLRAYFYGYETSESYWEGEDDYPIRVRLEESARNDMNVLDRLFVSSPTAGSVRLASVARIHQESGATEVNRKNRQRYVTVDANVHGRSLGEVTADARIALGGLDVPPEIRIAFGGQVEEQADSFRQLGLLALLGVLLVYMVMAGQYEAYLDPFVIMFSVPFALTGVAFAYLLTGLYLSIQGILGIIMLVGIVVNNAIVLVDYINLVRARGLPLRPALLEAGERRLRPVLMTTLTTFFGMVPMAVNQGEGAEVWRPLAVSVMGGLLLSTLVTLILVPVVYSLVEERVRRRPRYQEAREVKADEGHMDPVQ